MTITYTAAIGTASDVVLGDFCDVTVVENAFIGYREFEVGGEMALAEEYGMTDKVALDSVETGVRIDDENSLTSAPDSADKILAANGWTRTGDWTTADNALYAPVERTN
jgi:hypothetical protein